MLDKFEVIKDCYFYLEEQMADLDVIFDMDCYIKIGKEYKDFKFIVEVYDVYVELFGNIDIVQEMIKEEDSEMWEMVKMELEEFLL